MPNLMKQMFLNDIASRVVSDTDEADWYLTLVAGGDHSVRRSAEQFVKRLPLFADKFANGGFLSELYTVPGEISLWQDGMLEQLAEFEIEVTAQLFKDFPDLRVLDVNLNVDMHEFILNVYCKFLGVSNRRVEGVRAQEVLSVACNEAERWLSTMDRDYISIVSHFFEEMDWYMTKLAERTVDPALQARFLKAGGLYVEWGAYLAKELQDEVG